MSFYIYKYVYEGNIVYIGKTNSLERRINQHKKEKIFEKIDNIYYFLCQTQKQMDLYESLLIYKYKPALNIKDKLNFKNLNIDNFIEPSWIKYDNNTLTLKSELIENESTLEDFFTVAEAAKYANVSKQALYQQKNNNTLKSYIFNNKTYFKKEDIYLKYNNNNNNFKTSNELELLIQLAKKYNAKLIFE